MEKCYSCGGKMESGVDLIVVRSRTITQRLMKCTKCGKGVVSAGEYERVRKELHPSFLNRIKSVFSASPEFIEISKGKLL